MVKLEPTTDNGLSKISAADTFQVRSLSQERFVRKLGQLDEKAMQDIQQALLIVLDIFPYRPYAISISTRPYAISIMP
jgi:mRNA interferase MazF